MKITTIIATRGRPTKALAAIEALKVTASWANQLEVVVACDDDDPADTADFFRDVGGVTVDCGPRPAGVGECWNRVAGKVKDGLILVLPDDGIVMTPRWDQKAVEFFGQHRWPHPDIAIGALQDTASPNQHTLFMLRPGWVKRCGLLDTRYPFWFADTALAETYSFISGHHMPFLPIVVAMPSDSFNPRLRDMGLWWSLFASSRQERLHLAQSVRWELDLPNPGNLADILAAHQARDLQGYKDSLLLIKAMPNRKAPDDAYRQARANALWYLLKHDNARHLTGEKRAYDFALDTMEVE